MIDISIFGRVFGAAGVQGFFGEGYPHYNIPFRKPNFEGMTLVSKTLTLRPREGNVKKKSGILEYLFPSWVKVNFFSGHIINAMGLPNLGVEALLKSGRLQKLKKPLFISIMAVENTLEKRLDELRRITDAIGEHKNDFSAEIGVQINRSCPNLHHEVSDNIRDIVEESSRGLQIASVLGVTLTEKYAVDTAPVKAIRELQSNPNCHGICVSNTIKFGWKGIDWKKVWGSDNSPLANLGGGGLSGPELLPHVIRWIKELRNLGFKKHINGGGGIWCREDVEKYRDAGADSIFVGTVATYHPRRVAKIINHANNLEWR